MGSDCRLQNEDCTVSLWGGGVGATLQVISKSERKVVEASRRCVLFDFAIVQSRILVPAESPVRMQIVCASPSRFLMLSHWSVAGLHFIRGGRFLLKSVTEFWRAQHGPQNADRKEWCCVIFWWWMILCIHLGAKSCLQNACQLADCLRTVGRKLMMSEFCLRPSVY